MTAAVAEVEGKRLIIFQDQERLAEQTVALPIELAPIIQLLDGNHSVRDIQEALMRETGELVMTDHIQEIVDLLDQHLILDSPRFQQHMLGLVSDWEQASARPISHAGAAYPEDPAAIEGFLDACYENEHGPGKPDRTGGSNELKGILAPHMNPSDTGAIYAHAYKALIERSRAKLFIILGTGHYEAQQSFVLTEKDYQTPLGIAHTDKEFVSRIKDGLTDCTPRSDMSHSKEHSIEFQVLFLQHALAGKEFKIVPILVSSLGVSTMTGESPADDPAIGDFLRAIKQVLAEDEREVCFITSGDLAHLGPQYGDAGPVYPAQMQLEEEKDRKMLKAAEKGDAQGFFQQVAEIKDARHVCGFPPLYAMLALMGAQRGELLKWDYWNFEQTRSVVTMASMAFY